MTDLFFDIPDVVLAFMLTWVWPVAFWIFVAAVVVFVFKLADYWISSWQTERWYQRTYNPKEPND